MATLPALSVQLYSVRTHLAEDLPGSLARLAAIGLTQVEPYDLLTDPAGLRKALDDNGLTAPSAHTRVASGSTDLDQVFESAATVGVGIVIDPMTDPARWTTLDGIKGVAEDLAIAAQKAAGYGITIGYHNHAFEWQSDIDGTPGLEVLASLLEPSIVLEVDTYWAAVGGQDVPAALGRLGDRVQLLHLKDGPINPNNIEQLPLGQGAMPVARIVAAATALRIPVLEFDDYAGDVFDGIDQGFTYAQGLSR
ncbi:Sugar phosphate isomerase/epimerase [Nakamurella panacisegetis]|uniref:Sugar phosphate isomerase/epimerase n=1 Tax=Nakamurella panacisegetis TaxID=1090615 RepID=A0A1H0LV21_9ACTN|nr:sugar phosphate isomerase/epimerase [Nakamurella panacisegetis]SDO72042.1 Sugar phosphate isomerase/epimerase [Nakamurella panacisegetis]